MSNATPTITQEEHEAALAEHRAKIEHLEERVAQLQHMIWGRRSEKQPPSPDAPFQSALFSEQPVSLPPESEEEEGEDSESQGHSAEPAQEEGKKNGRSRKPRFGPEVERQVIDIELPESERKCSCCGEELSSIGFESAERAHYVPAKIVVHEERRHKYACKCKKGGVTTTPVQPAAFPKSRVTDELRAHVIVSKFVDHCPYYRQSAILRRLGYEISESSMSRMGIEAADRLAPIIIAMHEELLASSFLQADETTIPVLKTEKTKPGAHRGYLWAYGIPRSTIVYDYTRTRAGRHPSAFLEGYEGILQTDRYSGYTEVQGRPEVIDVGCWAHSRRGFFEAKQTNGRKVRPILEAIQKLYAVERDSRDAGLPPDERSRLRKRRSKPILDELNRMLRDLTVDVRPEGILGKAITYALGNWAALTAYLECGEAEIDTNLLENSMRPVALGRKNYLFAGSELGAEAAAITYSLTESCRRLGIHPQAYLADVFRQLATVDPKDGDAIRALTPARWQETQQQQALSA